MSDSELPTPEQLANTPIFVPEHPETTIRRLENELSERDCRIAELEAINERLHDDIGSWRKDFKISETGRDVTLRELAGRDARIAELEHELENVWKPTATMNEQYARGYKSERDAALVQVSDMEYKYNVARQYLVKVTAEREEAKSRLDTATRELTEAKAEIARLRDAIASVIADYDHEWPNEDFGTRAHRVRIHTLLISLKGGDAPCPITSQPTSPVSNAAQESKPPAAAMVCEHGTFHPAFPCSICERDQLKAELAAVRVCFAEASHNTGPAFVAHEELAKVKAENEKLRATVAAKDGALGRIAGVQDRAEIDPVKNREIARAALSPEIANEFVRREVLEEAIDALREQSEANGILFWTSFDGNEQVAGTSEYPDGKIFEATIDEIAAVIASAIAEHEKANAICQHCGKTESEHKWGKLKYCGPTAANCSFTPADPTKEKP